MKKKKGISLIVLVITIIVMIILAAAIIISLNNSGIIGKANKAVNDTNEQEVNHIASLAWGEAYLNGARTEEELTSSINNALTSAGIDTSKYLIEVTTKGVTVKDKSKVWVQEGLNIKKGNIKLKAGDLIQYNAGVSGYTGAWKVLGAEDGNLLIMSTADVGTLGLYGLEGGTFYNITYEYGLLNGIQRLNELCEPYGKGTGAVGARSIKQEDVDKLTGYDKTTYCANQLKQYGNEVTYSWNTTNNGKVDYTSTNGSGTLSITHSSGFSYVDFDTMTKTTVAVNTSGLPKLTSTRYEYIISSQIITELIMGTPDSYYQYWFASYFIDTSTNQAFFGLSYMNRNAYTTGKGMCTLLASNGYKDGGKEYGVRAVVELSPNIKIGEKDNTLGWSYTI